MLYERWRQLVRERGRERALCDLASGQSWTFAALADRVEAEPAVSEPVVYPSGNRSDFILDVLRAWRSHRLVCPLETERTPPWVPRPPDSCVHLKTTSATTGASRGVVFTAPQLAADADNIVATMGLRPDWPNLGAISLAHSFGFSNLVLPLLLHGVPLILIPSPLPELVRAAARECPAVTLAGVPALWIAWHASRAIPPNVRLAISAGAPLPVALEQEVFAATGIKIHNFYGATECGGIAYDPSSAPRTDDACVGAPMRHVELTLDARNCLRIHGAAVGESYWPDQNETLREGCFQTSDLAELKDGSVYLRGRLSDLINVAGRKVSPLTIEQALKTHETVRECLVFGVPSGAADRADLIVACVAAKAPISGERLKQFLLDKLPAWQVPREWWFQEAIATNPRGKVSRAEWRRRFLGRGPAERQFGPQD